MNNNTRVLSPPESILMIGCGNMGRAVLEGMLHKGVDPADVTLCVHSADSRNTLRALYPAATVYDAEEIAAGALAKQQYAVIIYAAKPQQLSHGILTAYTSHLQPGGLVVSLAAGALSSVFAEAFSAADPCVIRAMPNTPALIGKGVTGLYAYGEIEADKREQVTHMLEGAGAVHWLENEALMHVVTAVSGSGPAYVFHLLECLQTVYPEAPASRITDAVQTAYAEIGAALPDEQDTPVKSSDPYVLLDWVHSCQAMQDTLEATCDYGIPLFYNAWLQAAMQSFSPRPGEHYALTEEDAALLVKCTLSGALALAETSGTAFATLRQNVTSKGGTTAAGLAVLMQEGGEAAAIAPLMHAVVAAAIARSIALAA